MRLVGVSTTIKIWYEEYGDAAALGSDVVDNDKNVIDVLWEAKSGEAEVFENPAESQLEGNALRMPVEIGRDVATLF